MNKHDIVKNILKQNISYSIKNNALCFLPDSYKNSDTAGNSLIGKIQDSLKQYGYFYYNLLNIFKPVWRSKQSSYQLNNLLKRYPPDAIILNLGSGPRILNGRNDIINIDIFEFNEVDILSNAEDIPIADGSVDLIINQALLEHTPDPKVVVDEMYRLLKSGGEIYCYLPFIVPFHAAPNDFQRWTMPGVKNFFKKFDHLEVGIGSGPTSGMLWVFQEWLSLLLSIGSRRLHDIIFLLLMVLTAPLKLLDVLLIIHPYAYKIASGFYIVAKK